MDPATLIKLAVQAAKDYVIPFVKDTLGDLGAEAEAAAYKAIDPLVADMVQKAYELNIGKIGYKFARPYLFEISQVLRDAGFSEVTP